MSGPFDYVIIGGGIAGTTAAETIRDKDSQARIAILESGAHPLYSKVMIPAYLKKKVDREKIFLRNLSHYNTLRIDFYPNLPVTAINDLRHEITTGTGGIITYKKLLISAGAKPEEVTDMFSTTTPIEPLRMHTVEDADKIMEVIETAEEKKILVAGEGFIALEFIEVFLIAGFEVHAIAEKETWGLDNFGAAGSTILEENFTRHKITVHHNAKITLIKNDEFYLQNGDHFKSPYLAVGMGVARNLSFLPELAVNRGIITDEYMRTSHPDIYAAGDVAEYFDTRTGERILTSDWTSAFLQGRTAAFNMMGGNEKFDDVPSYNIVNLGLNISNVGRTDLVPERVFEIAKEDKTLVRVLLDKGKIIGGVLINRFNDKHILQKLIEDSVTPNDLEKIFHRTE